MSDDTHSCASCDRTYNVTVNSRCPNCGESTPEHKRVVIR